MASFEYEAGSKMLPAKAVRSVFVQPLGVRDAIILHFTQCLAWCAETPPLVCFGAGARGPGSLGLAPVVATASFPLINLPNFILASLS